MSGSIKNRSFQLRFDHLGYTTVELFLEPSFIKISSYDDELAFGSLIGTSLTVRIGAEQHVDTLEYDSLIYIFNVKHTSVTECVLPVF
ncbi:hypothetical protein D3C73_1551060 [compost metagenome]